MEHLIFCFFIIAVFIVYFFMMYRNKWISDELSKAIKKVGNETRKYINDCHKNGIICDVNEFYRINYTDKYWSYEKMLINFLIWDIEKMTYYN